MLYWRYGEYVGIGPGAHGRLMINNQRHATADRKTALRLAEAGEDQRPRHGDRRCADLGGAGRRVPRHGPAPQGRHLAGPLHLISGRQISETQIEALKGYGFVETLPNGNLRVTDKGFPVLDAVVADLAA
jgi:coproporphyrinogen III oxidase-like Fe-S oxidoreductase